MTAREVELHDEHLSAPPASPTSSTSPTSPPTQPAGPSSSAAASVLYGYGASNAVRVHPSDPVYGGAAAAGVGGSGVAVPAGVVAPPDRHAANYLPWVPYAFIGLLVVLWVVWLVVHPPAGIVAPTLFVPVVALYKWYSTNRADLHSGIMTQYFAVGFTTLFVLVTLSEAVGYIIWLAVLQGVTGFSDDDVSVDTDCPSCRVLSLFVLFFFVKGPIDDAMKYWVQRHRAVVAGGADTYSKKDLIYNTSTLLGFGVADSTFIFLVNLDAYENDAFAEHFGRALLLALLITMMNSSAQCLSGYTIGLGIAKRFVLQVDTPWWHIVLVPMLLRSTMLWLSFVIAANVNNLAGVFFLVLLVCSSIMAVLVWYTKRRERELPARYLTGVGYLNAFGYGVLEQVEDDDLDLDGEESGAELDGEDVTAAHV